MGDTPCTSATILRWVNIEQNSATGCPSSGFCFALKGGYTPLGNQDLNSIFRRCNLVQICQIQRQVREIVPVFRRWLVPLIEHPSPEVIISFDRDVTPDLKGIA